MFDSGRTCGLFWIKYTQPDNLQNHSLRLRVSLSHTVCIFVLFSRSFNSILLKCAYNNNLLGCFVCFQINSIESMLGIRVEFRNFILRLNCDWLARSEYKNLFYVRFELLGVFFRWLCFAFLFIYQSAPDVFLGALQLHTAHQSKPFPLFLRLLLYNRRFKCGKFLSKHF